MLNRRNRNNGLIIEITEEEREFLERVCSTAEIFSMKNRFGSKDLKKFEGNTHSVKIIKDKFKSTKEKGIDDTR